MTDTEFRYDPWGDAYFKDVDGDELVVRSDQVGGGMDILIEVNDKQAVYVNARELIAAAQKVAGLDITILDNQVHLEIFGEKPEARPRQYIGKIEGVDGWVPLTPEPLGTLSSDGIDLTPQRKGEDPFAVLCELYATQIEAGASRERTAATMARIIKQSEVKA